MDDLAIDASSVWMIGTLRVLRDQLTVEIACRASPMIERKPRW